MSAPTLAYDDLPPGSDIRRLLEPEKVQFTIPAGEPPRAVLKQAAFDALASGALLSGPLLLLAVVIFYLGIRANRISGDLLTLAYAFFALFCVAAVSLVSWVRYGMIIDALRAGRRQSTVIAATPQRLLIETAGPFGLASHDLPRDSIVRITAGSGVVRDERAHPRRVSRLAISLRSGGTLLLLPARDPRELRWIASAVTRILRLHP